MLENYLYYDGVDTRFATNGYQFFLQNEAPELSFDFNQIIYDPDSGQYQLLTNDSTELVEMNELQKAEIQDYLVSLPFSSNSSPGSAPSLKSFTIDLRE